MQMYEYIKKLLEVPIVGHLGTRDENHHTDSTIFFSAVVLNNPLRLVAHVSEARMAATRRNLLVSDYAAMLFGNPIIFEAVQVKGPVRLWAATQEEESYQAMMVQRFAGYNYPDKLLMKFLPLVSVEMTVIEMYNQTPGVGAGERMAFGETGEILNVD
jgi:hypothetical protein